MRNLLILLVFMLFVAACSTSSVKEELVDENGNVLSWADCYAAIQDYVGDTSLYDKLLSICQAQDPAGYEEWKSKITSKLKVTK